MTSTAQFREQFETALRERLFVSENLTGIDLRSGVLATINLANAKSVVAGESPSSANDEIGDIAANRHHRVDTPRGSFWISGNVVMCACPDCEAPMTVRSWLRLADCWRCDASIQLTREQIEDVESLLDRQTADLADPIESNSLADDLYDASSGDSPFDQHPRTDPTLAEFNRLTANRASTKVMRRGLSGIPAWLLSFLLHLILILLLALFVFSTAVNPPTIMLSTFVSPERKLGGEIRIENPEHSLVDDLLMANDLDVDLDEARDVIQKAREDAAELTKDETPLSTQPDLDQVRRNLTTERDELMSFAARDPRVRSEIVQSEGGTSLTEAAVARGLRWLAKVQNEDGSWSLANYSKSHRRSNNGDVAATSLALLPFLGAGQTHEFGIYRETVARGLAWLIRNQKSDGDLRINFPGQAGMYAHGQATIVLCEALAMTGDQKFLDPAQRAIEFIENAQHSKGGWRYRPGQTGDTSMLGWHLMALQSARAGELGISVSDSTFKLADYFLDQAIFRGRAGKRHARNLPIGSLYTYRPGEGEPTASMTAEAMLCRMYLGWKKDDPRMIEAVRWLIEQNLPDEDEKNIYYWYYGTQVMHHFGGESWQIWNRRMREILVGGQQKSGRYAGSWNPRGYQWGSQGGRIYVTSLSVCTLEVYYRHLPIFEQLDLSDSSPVSRTSSGH